MKKIVILLQGVTIMLLFFIGKTSGFSSLLIAAMILNLLALVLNIVSGVR